MTVYTELRRMVVDGDLDVARRISEAELAARLQVSRTPVREALSRLDGDGLVASRGRGVWVRVLDDDGLRHVLEARAALESAATASAAALVGAGQVPPIRLRELRDRAAEADRLTRDGDVTAAVRANRAFHQTLAGVAGNPVVTDTLDRWWDQIVVATRRGLDRAARIEQVAAEHDAILDAVEAGDVDAARRHAHAHVTATIEEGE